MRSQNILGHKLNQNLVKKQLKLILANIILRFSTTFDTIPLLWREKCLMAIAQKYNYNMRRSMRRQTTISRSSEHQPDNTCQDITESLQNVMEPLLTKAELVDEPKPFRVRTLESIIVFITMVTSERCTICRMVDFVMQGSSGNLTIESLKFDRFTSILKEDIQFDSNEHNIFYRCTKGMPVAITNE
jgi:hypothetical protein